MFRLFCAMPVNVYHDYETLSRHAADEILQQVQRKPDSILCLAAGDTPRLTYETLTTRVAQEGVDFSRCTFVGLDEWIAVPPDNEGSCAWFLHTYLFKPLSLAAFQIHLFDALSPDLQAECDKMNETIRKNGGIDLMLVGIGMNGHIGFNEPGTPADSYAHVVDLDATTRSVGQKYFKQQTSLTQGITLGLKHLLEARKVILIASGDRKAGIVQQTLEGPVTPDVPATILRSHANCIVMLDTAAASEIKR
ncbi:MAG TPA: glucosamine-6-phosphate deaminase [Cyclobacteriaceae bacterium]|jgi:glucosamine-6-phosphate isomerase|nr:glucosamine-6-phosphate deaminase [Cyclobacteriaceae bacterium]HLT80739.1 glucosamine-6-phosphate deaminase [Cyclobacteriaceae bacterium]